MCCHAAHCVLSSLRSLAIPITPARVVVTICVRVVCRVNNKMSHVDNFLGCVTTRLLVKLATTCRLDRGDTFCNYPASVTGSDSMSAKRKIDFAMIIDRWPSKREFAEDIGVTIYAARAMARRRSVSKLYHEAMLTAAERRGIRLSYEDILEAIRNSRTHPSIARGYDLRAA